MTEHLPAILLATLNLLAVWLLMAAPVGVRTVFARVKLAADAERIWQAISPRGESAAWHHATLSSMPVPGAPDLVEQSLTALDRHGAPVRRVLEVKDESTDESRRTLDIRVVEDSTLDVAFWTNFHERITLQDDNGDAVTLTVARTDRYRGLALLLLRHFALRRELKALERWLATGVSSPQRFGFEHPAFQVVLAVLSTLILWPFFGLSKTGLLLSVLLTVVIVLHEFGHMLAYRAFGHSSTRMIFVPLLGGVAIGGRPYNSLFEVASCALMGAGMSAFLVPAVVAFHQSSQTVFANAAVLFFLLILGAFNLLNLLPMNRFDGGQVLRQVFPGPVSLTAGSFLVTVIILTVGWRIGVPYFALVAALAVFALLSLMGHRGIKPRHRLVEMSPAQRLMSGLGLYAALALHGYAVIYATDRLVS
ncbi:MULTISPECIES: hypothetical protein [unclassified Rhizobium]|uniref:hypothetical protein n=1 Tax=unclassified Rhizobium TaxID=2613769 RepID=UPI0006F4C4B7|nr:MULTISPECIES: hypothetical protein [unclassified Rhizobium]KQV42552.1 hypothetical protein ASC86_19675 [Rhizobium sp. Root1212]KRD21418.1 hypothetical protein ASE37_17920 [Rhizobium sp. Root268]